MLIKVIKNAKYKKISYIHLEDRKGHYIYSSNIKNILWYLIQERSMYWKGQLTYNFSLTEMSGWARTEMNTQENETKI